MTDPITLQQIVAGLTVLAALSGFTFFFVREINKVHDKAEDELEKATDDLSEEVGKLRDDLAAYKLLASNVYARNTDIRDVEIRVLSQVANVAVEVRHLRDSIDKLLREMALNKKD